MGILNVVPADKWVPYFNEGYQLTIGEIQVDDALPEQFAIELLESFTDGDARKAEAVSQKYLRAEKWRWIGQHEQPEYHIAVEQFVGRVFGRAYLLRHYDQIAENTGDRPFWQLDCNFTRDNGGCEHKRRQSKVYRFDNDFWTPLPLPCRNKNCPGRIRAFDSENMAEHGLKISRG